MNQVFFIFLIGLLLMLIVNFTGRKLINSVKQTTGQLVLISLVQALLIAVLVVFVF
ncbi:hypothetical protein [Alkalicoccus halolimnae]|uniref:Uncharacterized protein n=1 Tax=Alkalicoccus halolimnae TaxID=1667239 RepID=A0AAJ8N3F7_9BACI|nr:hypothetical protein [Alkalicoccus halolimnae]